MTEHPMKTMWRTALWRQFGAAIATLENALVACPASLWQERLWSVPPPPEFPPQFAEFWYITFHALVWLDLYLSGLPEEEFAPPAPFAQGDARFRRGAARTALYQGGATRLSRVYAPEVPHHTSRLDGRAGAPARRVSLVTGATHQLSGVATLQSAPRPGTRGPVEHVSRTARHPGRGA